MYKTGIIGAGMIAEKHLESIAKINRLEATYLADLHHTRLEKVSEKFKVPHITNDYHKLLASEEVDAVIICTPPNLHLEMLEYALKAGKHVLLEKPAGMNREEMAAMIKLEKEHPHLKVCECSARHARLTPKYLKAKEIVESGALGEIYYVHHNSVWRNGRPGIEYHPEAKWFMNKKIAGGGPLFDWGVYDLSFHMGLLGDKHELDTVLNAFLKSGLDTFDPGVHVYDVEEMFGVMMKLSGDINYFWERGNHANMDVPNETRVYGTRGGIKLGFCSWDSNVIKVFDYDKDGKPRQYDEVVDMEGHSDEDALAEHFADILDGKAEPAMPLERVGKHLDIIWKCYEKAEMMVK